MSWKCTGCGGRPKRRSLSNTSLSRPTRCHCRRFDRAATAARFLDGPSLRFALTAAPEGTAGLRSGRPHPEITKTAYRRNQVRQKSTRETSRGACVGRRGRGTGGPNQTIKVGQMTISKVGQTWLTNTRKNRYEDHHEKQLLFADGGDTFDGGARRPGSG